MNTWKYLTLIALFFAGSAWAQAFGPAVTINGENIPRDKLQAQVDHMINQRGLNSGGITQPAVFKQIQQEVIDQLIVQELLWQEAKRRNFIVEDEIVNARLQQMKSQFDTELAFQFKIQAGGFTEETYREDIRQQVSVQRMISEGIAPGISISDEEVGDFYTARPRNMRQTKFWPKSVPEVTLSNWQPIVRRPRARRKAATLVTSVPARWLNPSKKQPLACNRAKSQSLYRHSSVITSSGSKTAVAAIRHRLKR